MDNFPGAEIINEMKFTGNMNVPRTDSKVSAEWMVDNQLYQCNLVVRQIVHLNIIGLGIAFGPVSSDGQHTEEKLTNFNNSTRGIDI